jgi:hypothetical protein
MRTTNYKSDVFIFDIDGTLANHKGVRSPYDESKVFFDKPIEPVWIILNSLLTSGHKIVFVSGRTEGCREDTILWLQSFIKKENYVSWENVNSIELYMRKSGDGRKDSIIKKEIYDEQIFPHYTVLGVFDDRLQVCRMLYENNIFCFNVNQGLIEF